MRLRVVLQGLVIAFAATVGLVVYLNWQPPETVEAEPPVSIVPSRDDAENGEDPGDERPVASYTDNIHITRTRNGRDVFAIWAQQQIDYADGWNTWANVRVLIYGAAEGDDIEIRSDEARTSGAEGSTDFNEVRFVGNVEVALPSGGSFSTRRIDYDAVTGEVENCNRNTLRYAGLEIRADCMRFKTAGEVSDASAVAEELHMWGEMTIRAGEADADEAMMPGGLRGTSDEMRFRPGGELVRLTGGPVVNLPRARISGDEIVLDVGAGADELRGVQALGQARVRLDAPEGESESEDIGQTLSGDEVTIELDAEGEGVESLAAVSTGAEPTRLVIGSFGRLEAAELSMLPSEGSLTVRAERDVLFAPRAGDQVLHELTAGSLSLVVEADEPRSLDAQGGVEASLAGDGGFERMFRGGRLVLGWTAGELTRGNWPDGIELEVDGRRLMAERAMLDEATGAWDLRGEVPPSIASEQFEFQADRMLLGTNGDLRALGTVRGTIGGPYLAAAGALFGDVAMVQLRSGEARVARAGGLRLLNDVEVVWETQSLTANEIILESDPGRLRARGSVELVVMPGGSDALDDAVQLASAALADADDAPSEGGTIVSEEEAAASTEPGEAAETVAAAVSPATDPDYITVSADNLLVEQATAEVRIAGDASLRQGTRRIGADTMVVRVDESGDWDRVEADGLVEFEEAEARGSGTGLEYAMQERDLRLFGDEERPALFVFEGVDPPAEYRSDEELRVTYADDGVVIRSTQDGRATTSVVRQDGPTK